MYKNSIKRYFSTLIITLSLASFSLAGDIQCPFAPPPPPDGDDFAAAGQTHSDNGNYRLLSDLWEIVMNTDLF